MQRRRPRQAKPASRRRASTTTDKRDIELALAQAQLAQLRIYNAQRALNLNLEVLDGMTQLLSQAATGNQPARAALERWRQVLYQVASP